MYWTEIDEKGEFICKKWSEGNPGGPGETTTPGEITVPPAQGSKGSSGMKDKFGFDPKKPVKSDKFPDEEWTKSLTLKDPKIKDLPFNEPKTSGNTESGKGNGIVSGNEKEEKEEQKKRDGKTGVPIKPPEQTYTWAYCGCEDKTFQSKKTGKTFNCPAHYGQNLEYTDLDGTKIHVDKALEGYCVEKWFCPEGYEKDWWEFYTKCSTYNIEKNKKIAACEGKTPPPDIDAATEEVCKAFIKNYTKEKKYFEKTFQETQCISEQDCKKYAEKAAKGEIKKTTKTVDGKSTYDIFQSCLKLYQSVVFPFSPEAPPKK